MSRRLFLERRTYRRNRLQDGARLAPILGALLIFGPVFILSGEPQTHGPTSGWLVYFLVIWFGLIILTAVLSVALNRIFPAPESGDEPAPGPAPGPDGPEGR